MRVLTLGKKYKDLISEKEGILTQRAKFITGCDRYMITDKENNQYWFDEFSLELVDGGIFSKVAERINKSEDLDKALYGFGDLAKDKITGYKGKIVTIGINISGDITYGLTSEFDKNAKDNDGQWFDEGRIEVIEKRDNPVDVTKKRVGGAVPNLKFR